jgi:hypothetical protein
MTNLQPAIHRKRIKEGLMTEEESQRLVNNWKVKQLIKKYVKRNIYR